jgi:hypothetical protein
LLFIKRRKRFLFGYTPFSHHSFLFRNENCHIQSVVKPKPKPLIRVLCGSHAPTIPVLFTHRLFMYACIFDIHYLIALDCAAGSQQSGMASAAAATADSAGLQ